MNRYLTVPVTQAPSSLAICSLHTWYSPNKWGPKSPSPLSQSSVHHVPKHEQMAQAASAAPCTHIAHSQTSMHHADTRAWPHPALPHHQACMEMQPPARLAANPRYYRTQMQNQTSRYHSDAKPNNGSTHTCYPKDSDPGTPNAFDL